ncbi:hypothetical protein IT072_02470 [Leifsonia sp. ZF2019]|uniref:hypothetical protein n=1 Tax=Leifsonia sp. ZF2019 TaxID=2781978 RepID=UPI001CC05C59|nr:hypothetical protein [Leifsonia sp. ZF2019]UAJ79962.1 hypothetical protein IT072_02470 [Leifsonia sp. ZF2019]
MQDETRAALTHVRDIIHAEARWQYELHARGHVGAQQVAERMLAIEKCVDDFVREGIRPDQRNHVYEGADIASIAAEIRKNLADL